MLMVAVTRNIAIVKSIREAVAAGAVDPLTNPEDNSTAPYQFNSNTPVITIITRLSYSVSMSVELAPVTQAVT
jgi:hypothetical protein